MNDDGKPYQPDLRDLWVFFAMGVFVGIGLFTILFLEWLQ